MPSFRGSESFPIEVSDEETSATEGVRSNLKSTEELLKKASYRISALEKCINEGTANRKLCDEKRIFVDSTDYSCLHDREVSLEGRIGRIEKRLDELKAVFSQFSPNVALPDECARSPPTHHEISLTNDSDQFAENLPHPQNNLNNNDRVQDGKDTCDVEKEGGCPDVKFVLLPKLSSVKEEVQLLRDDAGRILIFLCSAAKKLVGAETLVAVAGTYVNISMHNEHVFTTNDSMKNAKLEAEIKSALYGFEIVNSLFCGQKEGVCIMFISSCPVLVKLMKGKSSGSIVSSLSSIYRELMKSQKNIPAHWCLPANISNEEKKIMNDYEKKVQFTLEKNYKSLLSKESSSSRHNVDMLH